jgi:hypothetical protein
VDIDRNDVGKGKENENGTHNLDVASKKNNGLQLLLESGGAVEDAGDLKAETVGHTTSSNKGDILIMTTAQAPDATTAALEGARGEKPK